MPWWQHSNLANHTDMLWMQEAELQAQPGFSLWHQLLWVIYLSHKPLFTSWPAKHEPQCRQRKLSICGTQPNVLNLQKRPAWIH